MRMGEVLLLEFPEPAAALSSVAPDKFLFAGGEGDRATVLD
jgi:hypothetical protein